MSNTGECAYCLQAKPLQRSHVIPDAFFRRLKAVNGGSLFKVEQGQPTRRTAESGFARLLCRECENNFNRDYDHPTLTAVWAAVKGKQTPIEHKVLAGFICSVLWRATVSPTKIYSGYRAPESETAAIANIAYKRSDPFDNFSFEVSRLKDSRGTISSTQLKNTIAVPYREKIEIGAVSYFLHHFIAAGVFFGAYVPVVPLVGRDARHLIRGASGLPLAMREISTLWNFRIVEDQLLNRG